MSDILKWVREQSKTQHANNSKWWYDLVTGDRLDRNRGELLALVHSEISEAWQGLYQFDDKLPEQNGALTEIADALIRVFDMLGGFGIEFPESQVFPELVISEEGCGVAYAINECHSSVTNLLEVYRKHSDDNDKLVKGYANLIGTLFSTYSLILDLIDDEVVVEFNTLQPFATTDLVDLLNMKAEYNKNRADHKVENRIADGGKKF